MLSFYFMILFGLLYLTTVTQQCAPHKPSTAWSTVNNQNDHHYKQYDTHYNHYHYHDRRTYGAKLLEVDKRSEFEKAMKLSDELTTETITSTTTTSTATTTTATRIPHVPPTVAPTTVIPKVEPNQKNNEDGGGSNAGITDGTEAEIQAGEGDEKVTDRTTTETPATPATTTTKTVPTTTTTTTRKKEKSCNSCHIHKLAFGRSKTAKAAAQNVEISKPYPYYSCLAINVVCSSDSQFLKISESTQIELKGHSGTVILTCEQGNWVYYVTRHEAPLKVRTLSCL